MKPIKERKEEMRNEIRSKRDSKKMEYFSKNSEIILKNVLQLPEISSAKALMVYSSKPKEVNTYPIITALFDMGKSVSLPIMEPETGTLRLSELKSEEELSHLKPAGFQVPEPTGEYEHPIEPEKIDAIIVPGLAFDKYGGRLGYGKGYFDSLLKKIRRETPIISLAYPFQVVKRVPVNGNDIFVDILVTPESFTNCKKNRNNAMGYN